jgi:spermidine dehydrogenase
MTNAPKVPELKDHVLTAEERDLGMNADITRRDFLGTVALGTGAVLLNTAAPALQRTVAATPPSVANPGSDWTGPGGVGDYASSNGNTWEVVSAGHGIRDHQYEQRIAAATSTGEEYDLVIVGGGFGGVSSACAFLKATNRKRACLILDNHPLIGGEAKRNEFVVRGQRLIGPQGSNATATPDKMPGLFGEVWRELGLPMEFEFGQMPPNRKSMEFPKDNYLYQLWCDHSENHGYFFDTPAPHWVTNPWAHDLEGTPYPEGLKRDLVRWRYEPVEAWKGDQDGLMKWLDSMTYEQYLLNVRKLKPEVARFADPIVGAAYGGSCDSISAVTGFTTFPGFLGLSDTTRPSFDSPGNRLNASGAIAVSFPGGNDGMMRTLVKWLNPEVVEGSTSLGDIHNGRIRFDAMDRPNTPCRMRTDSTVVRVVHDPENKGAPAVITYTKDGRLHSVRARSVIWAAASWSGKYAIERLPPEYRSAMESFPRTPMLVVNVALDNWRALYKLGYTCCSWRGGLGFTANLRAPMYVGDHRPPLDPDHPTILTLYIPFPQPGLPIAEQGKVARATMYATSYRQYESQLRQQLTTMFGSAGFDPGRDIAGIVINRWGHAYVVAGPGFFVSRDGKPTPRDVLRQPLGSLAFAHSELFGRQGAGAAAQEAQRAVNQIVAVI